MARNKLPRGATVKNEEAPKTQKAPYVPPTLQKQQLLQEVLGTQLPTTHATTQPNG
jgi:hypothetical protein